MAAINERVLDKYLMKPIEQPIDFVHRIRHSLQEYHLSRSRSAERQRLMAQFELMRSLCHAQSLPATLEAVDVCLSEQLLPSRRWAVLLSENDDLHVGQTSRAPDGFPANRRVPAWEGLPGWVLRNNRPVFALCPEDLPSDAQSSLSPPLMAVPLANKGAAIGLVLVSWGPEAPPLSPPERAILSFVADVVAVIVAGIRDSRSLQDYYVSTMASLMEAVEAKDT